MAKRLSPHFLQGEFRSHDGAWMPRDKRRQLQRLALTYLEPLRERFGPVAVVSGHRSDRHNARVGGAPDSYHLHRAGRRGAAADVICAKGSPAEWHRFLDGLGAPGLGLYPTFVHVDDRLGRARW